jgi:hypothetical protein
MDGIGGLNPTSTPTAQASQGAQANVASGAGQTQAVPSGLPPAGLAYAAAANTVTAGLLTSQRGVDPASVGGAYGGSSNAGGILAGEMLLPLLAHLTHANAEQALALIGVKTPTPGTAKSAASTTDGAASTPGQTGQDPAAASSGPAVVDPLWGRPA